MTPGEFPPIHPGDILESDFLKPLNLSQHQLAINLHIPATRINALVNGKRAITAETALRLARYFGTSPDFWMHLQSRYDLEVAEDEKAAEIARDVRPCIEDDR